MTLTELHAQISATLNKRDIFDAVIPNYVAQAAMWLERNYTFKYMERFVEFTLDPDVDNPRTITLPQEAKKIHFIRRLADDGSFYYPKLVDPSEVTSSTTAAPAGYWLDGTCFIWFDNTPAEAYSMEMRYDAFTVWPTDYAEEPWLAKYGPDFLIAQTMIQFGPRIRDKGLIEEYRIQRADIVKTLTLADAELRNGETSGAMIYDGNS